MKNPELVFQKKILSIYPDALVGLLHFSIEPCNADLEKLNSSTSMIVAHLKDQFHEQFHLRSDPVIKSYENFYKAFKKTYHVLPQVESVLFRDKQPRLTFPLLQIIFISELKNRLLTAVHDSAAVEYPLAFDVASGTEQYIMLNGTHTTLKNGDMFISDRSGVISSIIYGPDQRTKILPDSENVLVVVYGPQGIGRQSIDAHFSDILSLAVEVQLNPIVNLKNILPD